jgi:triosephosphate isomerase
MKTLFIIGNWKSYKTSQEAGKWLEEIKPLFSQTAIPQEKTIVLCPSFIPLAQVSAFIKANRLPVSVSSQDISPFGMGAYTGGVNGEQIKEFATFSLIGHSERRRFFAETDEILAKKVEQAVLLQITPVYCVQNKEDIIPQAVTVVGYEPVIAIGSGTPDTPENAQAVAVYIKEHNPHVTHVLYGGSVTPENVSSFTHQSSIDGVLVGGASLDANKFFNIAKNA